MLRAAAPVSDELSGRSVGAACRGRGLARTDGYLHARHAGPAVAL